jgi:hypothetical protein
MNEQTNGVEHGTHDQTVSERFERLTAEWKERSRDLSNTAQMAMLPSYQRLIGMGPSVVPLILAELRRERDHWFWALESITEQNPIPPEAMGKVAFMAQAWLRWGGNNTASSCMKADHNSSRLSPQKPARISKPYTNPHLNTLEVVGSQDVSDPNQSWPLLTHVPIFLESQVVKYTLRKRTGR